MITIRIAGINIGVDDRFHLESRFQGFLTDQEPAFTVRVTDAELEAENRLQPNPKNYLEFICAYRKIAEQLPTYDAFVFHGAVIGKDDKAFVFTAPSGTGKTTHIRFWLQTFPDAWVVNGDKPIICKRDGKFYACGMPWRGKEGYGGTKDLVIQSICCLSRGAENRIERKQGSELAERLMHQVYLPKQTNHLIRMLALMDECFRTVPLYSLACNLDPNAARIAYEAMKATPELPARSEPAEH
jgi:hypothetical protein